MYPPGNSTAALLVFPAAATSRTPLFQAAFTELRRAVVPPPPKDMLMILAPAVVEAQSMPAAIHEVLPLPLSSSTLPIASSQSKPAPATPTPLSDFAPTVPDVWVPWPLRSSKSVSVVVVKFFPILILPDASEPRSS